MAKMNFRFRKTFPILGKFLHWTVSKKGISLNLHLGPLSRSWGTRGKTTTIDAPGHFGLFWRKQETHSRRHQPEYVAEYAHTQARQHLWRWLITVVIVIQTMAELVRANVHFQSCRITGHPNIEILIMVAIEVGLLTLLWSSVAKIRNFFGFILVCVAVYFHWKLVGTILPGHIHCHLSR
jgi:hypothetical protein